MKLLFMALALSALAGCSVGQDKAAAEAAVARFHNQLDARQYHEIFDGADPEFRQSAPEGVPIRIFDTVRETLGTVRRTELRAWRVNFTPRGKIVLLEYATEFTDGGATESFAFRVEESRARLVSYHANSRAFMPEVIRVRNGPGQPVEIMTRNSS